MKYITKKDDWSFCFMSNIFYKKSFTFSDKVRED